MLQLLEDLLKIGGHNPIEISNYDCVLFFGPEMFNFNQIKEIILKKSRI